MPAALALARALSIAARSVDATAEASASSASSLARFFAVSKGGIRRLGGRLPDDGVKGRASPSAGAGAGAAAAEAMLLCFLGGCRLTRSAGRGLPLLL